MRTDANGQCVRREAMRLVWVQVGRLESIRLARTSVSKDMVDN